MQTSYYDLVPLLSSGVIFNLENVNGLTISPLVKKHKFAPESSHIIHTNNSPDSSLFIRNKCIFGTQCHTPYSKMAADLCGYKSALVASFKIKYSFEF